MLRPATQIEIVPAALTIVVQQRRDIGDVLRSPGGALVLQERLAPDERHRDSVEVPGNRPLRHLGPRDADDGAHRVNRDWLDAHLDGAARIDHALRRQRIYWKPEVRDGIDEAAAVLEGWRDVDVEVARESRL